MTGRPRSEEELTARDPSPDVAEEGRPARGPAPRPLPPVPPAAPPSSRAAAPTPSSSPSSPARPARPLPPPPYPVASPGPAPAAPARPVPPVPPPAAAPQAAAPPASAPPVPAPAAPQRAQRPLPPVPPPARRRFIPADETQVIPILQLPPVPPGPEGETEEEAQQREGPPGGSRGILRAAGTMAVATLVSRVTGLLRTMVLAAALGVGLVNDAYNTANTLPNIVYELLLGGVLTSVIVPLLVHAQERDRDGGVAYAQRLSTLAISGLVLVTAVAVVVAPLLTALYGIQGDPEQVRLANWLARILLVEIVFYGVGALAQAILNSRGVFGPPAWAPVLNNVVVIVTGLLFLAAGGPGGLEPRTITGGQVWLLGGGTLLGIVLQAVVLVPLLRRAGVPLRPRWNVRQTGLREVGGLGGWVVLYVAVSQVGVIVATRVANAAAREGGLGSSAFAYASLLFQMPYGIIGVALLTALVPRMSRAAARHDVPGVVQDLALGTRLSALGLLPVTAALTVLGPALGVVAFARGNTSVEQAQGIGAALAIGAFGLLPMAVTLLQLRVFYAMKDARTPTLIQVGMVAVRVPLLFLVPALVEPEHVVAGLMLATSVTYLAGWALGHVALRRHLRTGAGGRALGPVLRMAAAAAVGALAGRLVVGVTDDAFGTSAGGSLATVLVGTVVVGATTLAGFVLARVPELREPLAAVRARLGRG
ncbi:putative peptidoglycan lipid II flippase [Geodermatophilus telluris]|uniref:Putative peptidoglycan lipid II flippase n=1 Tax=Geodermatophilus telluris TaxID=1190417 RepID=A0A1G6U483_9ACTN|nr:murein biosynthesis integral membrane protein MurJ [Geodermatophilus telluris]SDD36091.1 putative peptidoglycan lipid II flippase [Geodermatophilus telluris]